MKIKSTFLRKSTALFSAAALLAASAVPAFVGSFASALQVTGRSITLSDSTPGATNVIYALTMTMPTAAKSLIVDFCAESPIIGSSTCTTPTGMSAATAAYSSTNPGTNAPAGSGGVGSAPTGFAAGTMAAGQLRIASSTATTAATKYTFYFSGITNPTTTGTFYARVYTYADNTYGSATTAYASPGSIGDSKDYGGFALSTTNYIAVTATVMETLTFCVSGVAPSQGCGAYGGTTPTTPNITLGHGTPKALDSTATDTGIAYSQISTNAQNGAVVAMKNTKSITCAGLSRDGGNTCTIGAQTTAGAIAPGNALFGAQVGSSALATGGTGAPTATGSTAAVGSWGTAYYMSNATYSSYGDVIYNTGGTVCSSVNTPLTFAASATPTTPAGVYSATESLIATGTF